MPTWWECFGLCPWLASWRPSAKGAFAVIQQGCAGGQDAQRCFHQPRPLPESSTFGLFSGLAFSCIYFLFRSDGDSQLDCLGSIQDKITVCATDDSYQKAKQSMALAEEETRSRSAIVIKPGGRYVGRGRGTAARLCAESSGGGGSGTVEAAFPLASWTLGGYTA